MIKALDAALAGLQAAGRRAGNAAANIANARSGGRLHPYDGYVPTRIVQTTSGTGTPVAQVRPVAGPAVPVHAPGSPDADADGLAGMPNVDLAAEFIDLTVAQRSYEASLVVLETAQEMQRALLDREA